MFPSLNWSPNWLSDVTSLQGIWAARLIRLAWAFLMIPCHIILVLFESYIPRSLVPVTLYDIHVNKTWSKSQKVMFPIAKRIAASVTSIGDPPSWLISSDKKIPVSTIISVYFHDLFNPGSFVHVQLEDIPLAQDSEDWIIGNARDPRNEIFPIESVPVFWLHTQPAMISEKGALLPESGGNCLPTALIKSKTVILYLVGGGFINGSSVEGPRCYDIARATGIRVMGLSYRKPFSPETLNKGFPAALQDAIAAYAHLCSLGYQKIIIAGDSAGANLSVSLLNHLVMISLLEKQPINFILPIKLLLYSPWVDLTLSSLPNHSRDYLTPPMLKYATNLYLASIHPRTADPTFESTSPQSLGAAHSTFSPALETSLPTLLLINKAYGEKQKLEIFITSGGEELLATEIEMFVENLKNVEKAGEGLRVEWIVEPNSLHVYQMLPSWLEPASTRSLIRVKEFLMK